MGDAKMCKLLAICFVGDFLVKSLLFFIKQYICPGRLSLPLSLARCDSSCSSWLFYAVGDQHGKINTWCFETGQPCYEERWGAGVETQKNVLGVFGGWGLVPFNEPYAPSLSTIYDGA